MAEKFIFRGGFSSRLSLPTGITMLVEGIPMRFTISKNGVPRKTGEM